MARRILYVLALLLCVSTAKAQPQLVGSINGVFDISDLGAASYTIPIKVPDGIGGMQPSLAFNYNSNNGNGMLGLGWSLSGLSAITRVPNNIYHDKKVDGIKLNASDRFALDGNRLVGVYGTYGAAASQYHTEIQSCKTIVANGQLGTGPESFAVTAQDGTVYEYGLSANSRATIPGKAEPYMWLLEKVTDLSGNYMTYTYFNTAGSEVLPQEIKYNSNSNATNINHSYVHFQYNTKSDPDFKFLAGGKVSSTLKLNEISILQDANMSSLYYHSYAVEYANDFYTHLTKVTEISKSNTNSFAPTEFEYGPTASVFDSSYHVELASGTSGKYASADINGDGKTDIIQFLGINLFPAYSIQASSGNNTAYTQIQSGVLESDPGISGFENQILPGRQMRICTKATECNSSHTSAPFYLFGQR